MNTWLKNNMKREFRVKKVWRVEMLACLVSVPVTDLVAVHGAKKVNPKDQEILLKYQEAMGQK